MKFTIFLVALSSISLNALAQIALRKTMLSLGEVPSSLGQLPSFVLHILPNPWFLSGIFCFLLSLFLWLAVLYRLEVTQAYPLLSIGYVITAVLGYFCLHEDLNTVRLAGLALIIVGIIVISRS